MVNPTPGHGIGTPFKRAGRLWSLGWHTGADLAPGAGGAAIVSATPGRVIAANAYDKSYGYKVIIRWGDYDVWYCHMPKDAARVRVGDVVEAGQRIGTVGSTGNATGPHLHLELRVKNGGFAAANFRDPALAINYQPHKADQPNAGKALDPTVRYEITATALNGRGGPGTDFAVRATRPKGTQFVATRQSGKWVRASRLWYHTDFLRKVTTTKPKPTPPAPPTKPDVVEWYSASFGNLWGDDSGKGTATFIDRLPELVADLTRGGRDFTTGCEVRNGAQANALKRAMKDAGYPVGFVIDGNFAFFQEGTEIGYAGSFILPKKVQGGGRDEALLRIRAKVNGHWLHVGVSHLDYRKGADFDVLRVKQARSVLDAMSRFGERYELPEEHRWFIALDENSHTWTRDQAFLPAGFTVAAKDGIDALYVGAHPGRPVLESDSTPTAGDHPILGCRIGKKA